MPEPHDATFKRLCDFPAAVMQVLLGFAPKALAARLDLSTLERMSAEYVSHSSSQNRGDKVWRSCSKGAWR